MKTRLALFGPPGAGKGTQARFLADRLRFTHISTGRILRAARHEDTPVGRSVKSCVDAGILVPDSLMYGLVERALEATGWDNFVLDGFPRTPLQARWLTRQLKAFHAPLDIVVFLDLDDERILARLSRRRIHRVTGENFHLDTKPPHGIDPALIIRRKDDAPASVRQRLRVYHQTTAPVAEFFREQGIIIRVDAHGTFEAVHTHIRRLLNAA